MKDAFANSARIKICGLTRSSDAALAVSLGAWALGFIFFPKSPRFRSPSDVRDILSAIPDDFKKTHPTFGVFVNPGLDELKETVEQSGITGIQFHGNETPEFCQLVRETFPALVLTKVYRLEELPQAKNFQNICHYSLLDSRTDEAWGGTGQKVDWQKAGQLSEKKIILAGGLTPDNVTQAIALVNPFAVDVSSGVESEPGIKSKERLVRFFEAVKGQRRDSQK